jgi:hypothetical protein
MNRMRTIKFLGNLKANNNGTKTLHPKIIHLNLYLLYLKNPAANLKKTKLIHMQFNLMFRKINS